MSAYILPPPPQPSVAIANSEARFAVGHIYCVGQNYAAHAREMGSDPGKEPPVFFCKSAACLVGDGAEIPYPAATENLHYEGELVVAIGTPGRDIAAADALDHVWGYGPGNDLTRRDLQLAAKAAGKPWDMGKSFDNAAICGALRPAADIGHPSDGRLITRLDGRVVQDGALSDMILPVAEVIAHLSALVTLRAGDLIYTGTPSGVGPFQAGSRCEVAIDGVGRVETRLR